MKRRHKALLLVLRQAASGKRQDEVCKLIAGPTVLICDECTYLCADIVRKNRSCPGEAENASWAEVPVSVKMVPAQPDPITELRTELAWLTWSQRLRFRPRGLMRRTPQRNRRSSVSSVGKQRLGRDSDQSEYDASLSASSRPVRYSKMTTRYCGMDGSANLRWILIVPALCTNHVVNVKPYPRK